MADGVIIGGGGHARVVLRAARSQGLNVLGYAAPVPGEDGVDVPYVGADAELARKFDTKKCVAVLGMGKTAVAGARLSVFEQLQAEGFRFPSIVAQGAVVHENVHLGDGTVVLDGAVVATGAQLGRACIVNHNAVVDHDCCLGDDVHIAPGATLSGGVTVGDRCMIGAGATLIHSVKVCADCLIGAGATVVDDITAPGTYVGTPARRIK